MMTSQGRDAEVATLEEAGHWLMRLREDQLNEAETQEWLDWCAAKPENLCAFERMQKLWCGIPVKLADELESDLLDVRKKQDEHSLNGTDLDVGVLSPVPGERQREGALRSGDALSPGPSPGTGEGKSIAAEANRFQPNSWNKSGSKRQWGMAAAALIAIGAAVAFMQRSSIAPTTERPTRIEATARVNETSVLPDGSRVSLGAGSALALDFTPSLRRLEMEDGTAFFDVKTDKSRPFVVRAGSVSVTAIGTTFNVRRNRSQVVVVVEEGRVRIENDGKSVEAAAGYQLTYNSHSGESRLKPVNPAAELSWREGRLVYNGEPLEFVIADVNRYSAKPITLSDPALGQLKFTGTVLTDSIDTWLAALPSAFAVKVENDESETRLLRR